MNRCELMERAPNLAGWLPVRRTGRVKDVRPIHVVGWEVDAARGDLAQRWPTLLGGALIGAGVMYLLHPDRRARRFARLRDQGVHLGHVAEEAIGKTTRDLGNRATGLVHELGAAVASEPVDDAVLVERVRSKLGRLVRHPGAIEVAAENGRVTLSGLVLADEVARLLGGVGSVRGVTGVENRLAVRESAGDIPGLQGNPPRRRGGQFELLQENWAPAPRLFVGLSGGALIAWGLGRGGWPGGIASLVGLGLLARAVTNLELRRLVGVGAGRRAIDLQKAITIEAPVDEVFRFWSHFENFPRFMSHVKEVRASADGRSHWIVAGPAGVPVAFDTVVTEYRQDWALAWKTVPGSAIAHAGRVYFEPTPEGHTRVDVKLSYNPPAGALGHAVASLFGVDPKHAMDEDLVRLKSLLETGKTSVGGERVTRADVVADTGPLVPEAHLTRAVGLRPETLPPNQAPDGR